MRRTTRGDDRKDTVVPSARIAPGEWARGREMALIDAVQSTMLSAIKIPEWDRDIVLDVYDAARRIVSTGMSERFTRIDA